MSNSSPEFNKNSLTIKQDDKFFSRISKENSASNPSFRVYYGNVSGAVPFIWEIQPGTPKYKFSGTSVPPLTPPPSYYFSNRDHDLNKPMKRKYYPRSKILYKFLLKINIIKKGHGASSSLSSSLWLSSMSSLGHSSNGHRSRRSRFSSFGSSFDDGNVFGTVSPDSIKCFGMNNTNNRDCNGGRSTYTVVFMKKAFLSIVGRISG